MLWHHTSQKQLGEVKCLDPLTLLMARMGAWELRLRRDDLSNPQLRQKRRSHLLYMGPPWGAHTHACPLYPSQNLPRSAGPVKLPHRWHHSFDKVEQCGLARIKPVFLRVVHR